MRGLKVLKFREILQHVCEQKEKIKERILQLWRLAGGEVFQSQREKGRRADEKTERSHVGGHDGIPLKR